MTEDTTQAQAGLVQRLAAWRARQRRMGPIGFVVVLVFLLIAPYFGIINAYGARLLVLTAILALMVSGLNIVLGYAGELAMGQVAFYALGAYLVAYLGTKVGNTDVLIGLAIVIVAAVVVGLITGVPSLRLSGWPLAMVTFFLVLIIPNVLEILSKYTGGAKGMSVPVPTFFGSELGPYPYYIFAIVVAAIWFALVRNLIRSPHGDSFLVLKQSPLLASALGISVYRIKLAVYVLGTVPPAIAGALFAWLDGYIAPDIFIFSMAVTVLAASVLGGSVTIYGAILGAAFLQLIEHEMSSFDSYQLIVFGAFLIIAAIMLPQGLIGLGRALVTKFLTTPQPVPPPHRTVAQPDTLEPVDLTPADAGVTDELVVAGITKEFGGNVALNAVDMTARGGQVTALIGTNGSGKTTLLNVISGFYPADGGRIDLGSLRLDDQSADKVARSGVARTFQTPLIPEGVSTIDFVSLGYYTRHPLNPVVTVLRLPPYAKQVETALARAAALLELLGISEIADVEAASLPLGTRRMVELARALTSSPRVLLLDEVGSGLDGADLDRLENAIRQIREAGVIVILVEHNFPLVLRLADHIHVLIRGEVMVSGPPDVVRGDQRVIDEYLGNVGGSQVQ